MFTIILPLIKFRTNFVLGSRVAFNTLTGVIDANTVYGVRESFAKYVNVFTLLTEIFCLRIFCVRNL